METKVVLKKIYSKDLEYIDIINGQLLFCLDTGNAYYDDKDFHRINITINTYYLKTEDERISINNPLMDRVYIVGETEKLYYSIDNKWYELNNEDDLFSIIVDLQDLTPSILEDKGDLVAPRTLASAVFMNDGTKLSSVMKDPNLLTITKTKATYVEVLEDDQRIFTIPYPVSNYDLSRNHLTFIAKGNLCNPDRYVINNNRLILNSLKSGLLKGETVLFIFYYTIQVDLNDNVVLGTHNYGDKTITSEKIADSFRLDACKIIENTLRIFMTPDERDKLRSVSWNATNYHHPDTHPATMIVQDENHRFVTDIQIEAWNNKADSDKVYTKEEVDQIIADVLGEVPESLDTLEEIANSINNDPNFHQTMKDELAKKATHEDIDKVYDAMELKVDIDDYVRGTVYDTANLSKSEDADYYSISVADDNLNEYIDGMSVLLKIRESNTHPAYLKINNLEPKKILTQEQYELIKDELKADSIYTLRYNGTTGNFILQGKGGVKINHSTIKDYVIDKDNTITRGDIVDIIQNKARSSSPRINLINTSYSSSNKHYCTRDIKVNYLDDERLLVSWIDNTSLKVQAFKIKPDGFIEFNELESPLILNMECRTYDICVIDSNKFIAVFSTDDKKFNIINVNILDTELDPKIPVENPCDDYCTECKIIPLRNGSRAIITWTVADTTECIYVTTRGEKVTKISERTNLNYPISDVLKISDTQLLFGGPVENFIKGWVMNIEDSDFFNNTLINIEVSNLGKNFSNLEMIPLSSDNTKVGLFYTDVEETVQYRQNILVKPNGGIDILSAATEIYIEDKNNIIHKYMRYEEGTYITYKKNPKTYIVLDKIDEGEILNIFTNEALFNIDHVDIDFDVKNNFITLVYSTNLDGGENRYLFFSRYQIKRIPDGIALGTGTETQKIPVSIWK